MQNSNERNVAIEIESQTAPPRNQVSENYPDSIPLSNTPLALEAQDTVNRLIREYQNEERIRENYIGNALEILRPIQDNFFYTLVGASSSLIDVHEQIGHRIGFVGNKLIILYTIVGCALSVISNAVALAYCIAKPKSEMEICNSQEYPFAPTASYIALITFAHIAKKYSNFNAIRESREEEQRENMTTSQEPRATAEFAHIIPRERDRVLGISNVINTI